MNPNQPPYPGYPYYPSQSNYPPQGYPAQTGYPPQVYPSQPGYPPQGYPPQPGYPPQHGYPGYPQGYPPQPMYPQGYPQPGFPPQPMVPPQPYPLDDASVKDAVQRIKAASNKQIEASLQILRGHFTCEQAKELIAAITAFSNERYIKIKAMKEVYPRCVDPNNAGKLLDAFPSQWDRPEASKELSALQATQHAIIPPYFIQFPPVPESDVKSCIQNIKNASGDQKRQEIEFAAARGYFLAEHAKQIIQAIEAFANEQDLKLRALRAFYPKLADANNAYLLMDGFKGQYQQDAAAKEFEKLFK